MNTPAHLAIIGMALSATATASEIDAWSQTTPSGIEIRVDVTGQPNSPFAIWSDLTMDAPIDFSTAVPIARGMTNAVGQASLVLPANGSMPENFGMELYLLARNGKDFTSTGTWLPLSGSGGTFCSNFDPNFTLGFQDPAVGELINDQWDLVNMNIAGLGNAGNPNAVVVFDSANPTGNDTDLVTPGTGVGNTTAFGQVLILPENVTDADGDGNVDDPNDALAGGVMRFDFDEPYRMCSATVIDIDDNALSELRFFIGDTMTLETIPLVNLGDNSVQTLTFDMRNVRRFELALAGSGALARLDMVPCPLNVNLDESPFGVPRADVAGEIVTSQYLDLGLAFSAANNTPGNPDSLVLFDSGNPTGDDFDLMTPGPGSGNDTPLGLVVVIAENDIDADGDGLIDSPDDEAGGGQMIFDFTEDVVFFSAKVLDVDGVENDEFIFFDENGVVIDTLEINALGDNSVQTLLPGTPITGVRQIQVNIVGSGAVAALRWCPASNFE